MRTMLRGYSRFDVLNIPFIMNKSEGRSWQEAREDLLADQETLSEYERLRPRYALVGQIIGARAEQGITQAQPAERVGTKQTYISRLERGEGNPTLRQKLGV